jgi:hypothetical protein
MEIFTIIIFFLLPLLTSFICPVYTVPESESYNIKAYLREMLKWFVFSFSFLSNLYTGNKICYFFNISHNTFSGILYTINIFIIIGLIYLILRKGK